MPVVEAALKKIVVATVLGTIAKVIAAKIGMSFASAAMIILIPIIFGLLIKDIVQLPEKLGTALADAVCAEVQSSYSKTINEIVIGIFAGFATNEFIDQLAMSIGCDAEITRELESLVVASMG